MHVDFKYFAEKKKEREEKKTNLALILVPTTFDSILRFALQKRTDLYFEKEIILERGGERERERGGREGGRRQLFVRETRKVTF